MSDIKLPELKENVDTVEVNAVLVKPGDAVSKGQPLLEVQADKAALEVPAPADGTIGEVRVKAGDQIKVGQVICTLEAGAAPEKPAAPPPKPEKRTEKPTPPPPKPAEKPRAEAPAAAVALAAPPEQATDGHVPNAGPATRRLARELGVDLALVPGTGRNGRITEEDVKGFARKLATATTAHVPATPSLPHFEDFGPVEREPLSKVRQLTARHMSLAWSLIPHVTQHDEADITDLDAFRKSREGKGPKLTVTAFGLKACAIALKQFPTFNASIDLTANQLVLKRYCHIGVAVDTERGLLVPVIRDVDRKSVEQLVEELTAMAEQARQGKADMTGGCFTITNLGGIGGTGFTPIVNWPEVAILGLSRGKLTPTIRNGEVKPRLILPLSLSYDHRVIDGADAARFARFVAEMLENPWMMALKS
jgi:pyruvate dehydrogenase E2 component (dihydrolipoamide acetyltransferase)